jgi:hypothetical protein
MPGKNRRDLVLALAALNGYIHPLYRGTGNSACDHRPHTQLSVKAAVIKPTTKATTKKSIPDISALTVLLLATLLPPVLGQDSIARSTQPLHPELSGAFACQASHFAGTEQLPAQDPERQASYEPDAFEPGAVAGEADQEVFIRAVPSAG